MSVRCPVCFSRENDVVLFREGERWYCVKCSFTGTEFDVRGMYAHMRGKYRWITRRVTLEDLKGT
jgi:hypothetical protein